MAAYPQNHKVIDASHWNTITDFGMVKANGVLGVIHKFSQGVDMLDGTYAGRRASAIAAGLMWGRYHFGTPDDVAKQVAKFLTGWQPGELLALDWEELELNGPVMSVDQVVEFHDRVLVATGQHIVLYSGKAAKAALKAPHPVLNACRLWLSHYAAAPICPVGWDEPWLWQWTQHGSIPGVTSNVDLDSFDGMDEELRNSWVGPMASRVSDQMPEPPATLVETPVMDTVTVTITVPRGSKVQIKTTGDVEVS